MRVLICKGMGRSDEGQREGFRKSATGFVHSERFFTVLLRTRTEGPKLGADIKVGRRGAFLARSTSSYSGLARRLASSHASSL